MKKLFLNSMLFLDDCNTLINKETWDILNFIISVIKIAVPILLIVLVIKDFVTAAAAGKEEEMKKAQSTAIKRIIIAVIIFFIPMIINIIAGLVPGMEGTCKLG